MGQTAARTDALLSRPETGKMTASVIPIAAGWHPAMRGDNVGRMGKVRSSYFSRGSRRFAPASISLPLRCARTASRNVIAALRTSC